jgi:hypothetical protein
MIWAPLGLDIVTPLSIDIDLGQIQLKLLMNERECDYCLPCGENS